MKDETILILGLVGIGGLIFYLHSNQQAQLAQNPVVYTQGAAVAGSAASTAATVTTSAAGAATGAQLGQDAGAIYGAGEDIYNQISSWL